MLSSAQGLENESCRAVKPIVQLQAPGRRAKAPGGKEKFKQDVRLFLGEAGSGVSPVTPRHATPRQAPACPSPERLWKPHLTLPVSRGLSRETKVESSVSLPEARETVSAGPRSERGCFLPITSSSGLTSREGSAAHSDGKTSFERQSLFPPRLCGFPSLCIGLAEGLDDGLT